MANLVISKTGNLISVKFNDYYTNGFIPFIESSYNSVSYVSKMHKHSDHIVVWGVDNKVWKVIAPGGDISKGFVIDRIDGVVPTDLDHLYELITGLI